MLQTVPSRRADPVGSAPPVTGAYKVDISRGERIGRVSSEWFSRPADERYLSLSELFASVRERADRSRTRTVESAAIRVCQRRSKSTRNRRGKSPHFCRSGHRGEIAAFWWPAASAWGRRL